MSRSALYLVFFLTSIAATYGQDPIYSQFFAAPLQINPAFAGTTFAPRLTANYRNEWAAYEGGYETYSVAYEQSIESLNSGIGLMLTGDDAGDGIYQTTYFSGVYGYQVRLNDRATIRFGLEAGLIQRRLNWDRLIFLDQIDPIEGPIGGSGAPNPSQETPPDNLNQVLFDVGAGLMIHSQKVYGGLSIKHLNTPDESLLLVNQNLLSGLPMRITVHGGLYLPLQSNNKPSNEAFLSPNLLYIRQGGFNQVNGGAYFGLGKFFGGAWYRHTFKNADSAIALLGVRSGIFRLGYSFDFTLNGLTLQRTSGTHELSLTINFDDSKSAKNRLHKSRYNDCFKMFN
ncbi:MAG TPA: PorP/SprF family type IX secretion system membrane protein [Saprospiraceae bacterium]|nr:PorP/SprF family type IX secretion system membrane protein [Saprospiraceae bacterium]HMQ84102.1 PorP/SprF family type IX secretion system membrane protein [Saprospiraceae bacterium]